MVTVKIADMQSEKVRLDILDVAGRIVKSIPVTLNNSEQTLQVNVSSLSRGTYVIKLQLAQKVQTQILNKL
jgi:hypothetical protein